MVGSSILRSLLKMIFSDGFAGRLPVFLRNGEKSQNGNSNITSQRKKVLKQAEWWAQH